MKKNPHRLRIEAPQIGNKDDHVLRPEILPPNDEPPVVICNDRQLSDITAEVHGHIVTKDQGQSIFIQGGKPVYICYDEGNRAGIHKFTPAVMRGRVARVARFCNLTREGLVSCFPPKGMVQDLLALMPKQLGFPRLEGIIEAPALRPDGSVISTPGYDRDTGLFFAPARDFEMPTIPEHPSREEVFEAFSVIWDIVSEFPFVDTASGTNFLATLLTPIVRPAIRGPVPLALFDAPAPGTGKTLLAEIISLICCGHSAALFSAPHTGEEWRKAITSILREASSPVVVIDNVSAPLDSAELCKALTADYWGDRILGRSRTVRLPVRCAWIANGNNIRIAGDMPRRCYRVRLDAKLSEPWKRSGFKFSDLKAHVLHERGKLLGAILTLARAWFVGDCPPPSIQPLGSYEAWTTVIGGIIEDAGISGFLENADAQIDEESLQWEGFLLALYSVFGNSTFTTAEIYSECANTESPIHQSLPDFEAEYIEQKSSFPRRLGQSLRERRGRRFGESQVFVERVGTQHGAALWRVRRGDS